MGIGGHRRIKPTLQTVQAGFWWDQLMSEVTAFTQSCIHCKQIDGKNESRPWVTALHATKPNELIHWDWIDNVWAALLSRWGMLSTAATRCSTPILVLATEHLTPLTSPDFVWPSQQEIVTTQRNAAALLEGE